MSWSYDNPSSLPKQGIELLARVAGDSEGLGARRHALMSGLASLVGAESWFLASVPTRIPGRRRVDPWVKCHQTTLPMVLDWAKRWAPEFMRGGRGVRKNGTAPKGRRWWRVYEVKAWTSDQLREVTEPNGGQASGVPFICVALPETRGMRSIVCLARSRQQREFSESSGQFCASLLGQTPWITPSSPPGSMAAGGLSPRQGEVLRLLLAAKRRSEIAAELHISEDTAKGHIRDVYRYFKVASQVELLAYFLSERACCESSVARPCRSAGVCCSFSESCQ